MSRTPDTWILTADSPSLLGTVDVVTRYLFEQRCYVTEHHSFDDRLAQRFFIRVEFRAGDGFDEASFRAGLAERVAPFEGVKLVGATAHYINNDLDEGPIIAQGVETVDHAHYPEDLIAKGRDIECLTLARAVGYHIERRVFLNANRTVVL